MHTNEKMVKILADGHETHNIKFVEGNFLSLQFLTMTTNVFSSFMWDEISIICAMSIKLWKYFNKWYTATVNVKRKRNISKEIAPFLCSYSTFHSSSYSFLQWWHWETKYLHFTLEQFFFPFFLFAPATTSLTISMPWMWECVIFSYVPCGALLSWDGMWCLLSHMSFSISYDAFTPTFSFASI